MRIKLHDLLLLCWCVVCYCYAEESETADAAAFEQNQHDDDAAALFDEESSQVEEGMVGENKLLALLDMAERTIQSYSGHHQEFEKLSGQIAPLTERISAMQRREAELRERTAKVDEMIRQINVLQLDRLASRLNDTVQKEIQVAAEKDTDQSVASEGEMDMSQFVSLRQLESVLNPDVLLEESESQLNEWVQEVVREEVASYRATHASGSCVTPLDAARVVQSSLLESSEIERTEYLKGASVVYEMTTPTYVPPPKPETLLGAVWWRRYIPEDLELLLPSGWEDWNVGIPSSVRHTLGLKGGTTLPPEAILESNIHPGACWPMQGKNGQVTLRLKYPLKAESITIEHVSSLLVEDRSSAPKAIRVVGYRPCEDGCMGMGFDTNKWRDLGTVTYDIHAPSSTQTFALPPEGDDTGGPGSCSEPELSCDDPSQDVAAVLGHQSGKKHKDGVVGAVSLEVLDNWGNEDYTCLYRFRLHGQPVK